MLYGSSEPLKGKGHTFESCRVRHEIKDLNLYSLPNILCSRQIASRNRNAAQRADAARANAVNELPRPLRKPTLGMARARAEEMLIAII